MKRKRRFEIIRYRSRITVVQGGDTAENNGVMTVAADLPVIDIPPAEPPSSRLQKFLRLASEVWWKRGPP